VFEELEGIEELIDRLLDNYRFLERGGMTTPIFIY
jgi:hypothetical protein